MVLLEVFKSFGHTRCQVPFWLTEQVAVDILRFILRLHGKATEGGRLNRGDRRDPIFHKTEDFEAFERMIVEALSRSQIKLYSYCLCLITGTWWSARRSMGKWVDSANGWA